MSLQTKIQPLLYPLRRRLNNTCQGLENISPNKNYIFAANHQSLLDEPLLFSVLAQQTDKTIHMFMSHQFYDWLLPLTIPLQAIRIKMNKQDPRSKKYNKQQLQKGVKKLSSGNHVLIFPEGKIAGGKNKRIIRGETGVVRLAISAKKEIVPIGIKGTSDVYPLFLNSKNPLKLNMEQPILVRVGGL